eukprot:COSAG02_NODE_291_length_25510_cov_9.433828_10_plen_57_part_00
MQTEAGAASARSRARARAAYMCVLAHVVDSTAQGYTTACSRDYECRDSRGQQDEQR